MPGDQNTRWCVLLTIVSVGAAVRKAFASLTRHPKRSVGYLEWSENTALSGGSHLSVHRRWLRIGWVELSRQHDA